MPHAYKGGQKGVQRPRSGMKRLWCVRNVWCGQFAQYRAFKWGGEQSALLFASEAMRGELCINTSMVTTRCGRQAESETQIGAHKLSGLMRACRQTSQGVRELPRPSDTESSRI